MVPGLSSGHRTHCCLQALPACPRPEVSAPTGTRREDHHSQEGEAGMELKTGRTRGRVVEPTRGGGLPLPCCYGHRGLGRRNQGRAGPTLHDPARYASPRAAAPLGLYPLGTTDSDALGRGKLVAPRQGRARVLLRPTAGTQHRESVDWRTLPTLPPYRSHRTGTGHSHTLCSAPVGSPAAAAS